MIPKTKQKIKAIALRRRGRTYSEILKQVPVAKSTLSLWLREVGLAKAQKQRITKKRKEAQMKGAMARRQQRIVLTDRIYKEAEKEIGLITKRELWLMGIMLYWAEGGKEKAWRPGSGMDFSNSDHRMISLFLRWLSACGVEQQDIRFGIYIHENHKSRIKQVKKFWIDKTGFSEKYFTYVYFKKHNPKTKRRNIGNDYYGNLRVKMKASSTFVRKTEGWVRGVVKNT